MAPVATMKVLEKGTFSLVLLEREKVEEAKSRQLNDDEEDESKEISLSPGGDECISDRDDLIDQGSFLFSLFSFFPPSSSSFYFDTVCRLDVSRSGSTNSCFPSLDCTVRNFPLFVCVRVICLSNICDKGRL